MCGIIGYSGTQEAVPLLLQGLRRLEYRGYDSAGIAVACGGVLRVRKQAGKLAVLERLLAETPVRGNCGIGHTRWATHGPPTHLNAHPHLSERRDFAVAHNGIIENARLLRRQLQAAAHVFASDTDTEVLVHLIEDAYGALDPQMADRLECAVADALKRVTGAYGVAVLSLRDPGKIVVGRLGSPLLIGVGSDGCFVASDQAALVGYVEDVVCLQDGDLATITPDGYAVRRVCGCRVERPVSPLDWSVGEDGRGGYPHYMLKEIHQQPETLRAVLRDRLRWRAGDVDLGLAPLRERLREVRRVVMVGCGTSRACALMGEYMLERMARIPTEVDYGSEYRYRHSVMEPGTLAVAISQSGETADTLWALREARRLGATTLAVVNVVGSTLAREADASVFLRAGPEISVASTKAFTSQVVVLAMLTLHLARLRGTLTPAQGREVLAALCRLPEQVSGLLKLGGAVRRVAERYRDRSSFLYIGRGYGWAMAAEGALKLKEISYVHAEAAPGGEMEYGPMALVGEQTPVVAIATRDAFYVAAGADIRAVKARGAPVVGIVSEGERDLDALDHAFFIPLTLDMLTPVLASVPLQLLAYHMADVRGCDVDQPRNLAKSVTVE